MRGGASAARRDVACCCCVDDDVGGGGVTKHSHLAASYLFSQVSLAPERSRKQTAQSRQVPLLHSHIFHACGNSHPASTVLPPWLKLSCHQPPPPPTSPRIPRAEVCAYVVLLRSLLQQMSEKHGKWLIRCDTSACACASREERLSRSLMTFMGKRHNKVACDE